MKMNDQMQVSEEYILHTYNRFPVVVDHGEDVYIYDTDGNKYLDFAAGIAVSGLGYSNERYKQALKNQIDKLMHISNLYYHVPMMEAGRKVIEATGMEKYFLLIVERKRLRVLLRQQKNMLMQEMVMLVLKLLLWSILFMEEVLVLFLLQEQPTTENPLSL